MDYYYLCVNICVSARRQPCPLMTLDETWPAFKRYNASRKTSSRTWWPCFSSCRYQNFTFDWEKVNEILRFNFIFSARQHAIVHLSVRPSHGWIGRKRLKLGLCNFHHTVAPSLSCLRYKIHPEIPTGSPWAGASNKGGVEKTSCFLTLCVNISKTVGNIA